MSTLLLAALFLGPLASGVASEEEPYVFVFLKSGAREAELGAEELREASAGHFANMGRLADEGLLLIAGPLWEPRVDPTHRGIFLFDVPDLPAARALTETDPAVKAEALTLEAHPFRSRSPVRRLMELERARNSARAARGEAQGERDVRPYVLVTAAAGREVEAAVQGLIEEGLVPFFGILGDEPDGEALFALVAEDVDAARAILSTLEGHAWTFLPWYSTSALLELPRLAAHPDSPTFELLELPDEGELAAFGASFAKRIDVFGVHVVATADTPDRKVLHAAHVLAQYLDNDEDGAADNPLVIGALREHGAFLAMTATEEGIEEVDFGALERAGFELGQDLYGDETLPEGPPHVRAGGRFDAALEEVLHLVSFGYAIAYPDVFDFGPGSKIAAAMDRARGGRFDGPPEQYPEGAWYHYDDPTCEYGCQVGEYFYWALTSLLGGQDFPGRAEEIAVEWELPTADSLRLGDPAVLELLTDATYRLPLVLPDGGYRQ